MGEEEIKYLGPPNSIKNTPQARLLIVPVRYGRGHDAQKSSEAL